MTSSQVCTDESPRNQCKAGRRAGVVEAAEAHGDGGEGQVLVARSVLKLDEIRRDVGVLRHTAQQQQASEAAVVSAPAGVPPAQVIDPFALEVHHAIDRPAGVVQDDAAEAPLLPAYVERDHDRLLAQVVARAIGGKSSIAVLVGGSSTGKTRACWEALRPLRERPEPWRLWHPIDPRRPAGRIGPVFWR